MEFSNIKVLSEQENKLFNRKEVKLVLSSGSSPSLAHVLKFLSERFSKSEDDIAIKEVRGKFGRDTFLINANIYHSKEDKEKIEPKPKLKKGAVPKTE